MRCTTSDGVNMTLHPAIGSYCADLLEAKDSLGLRHGNKRVRNCPRCIGVSKKLLQSIGWGIEIRLIHLGDIRRARYHR